MRSTRYRADRVERLEDDGNMYYMYVFADKSRDQFPYQFEADINGRYVVENEHENNRDLEADYITTFFTLEREAFENGSVYLFGELTDWEIKEEFEMSYVKDENSYVLKTLLKQGYYNYVYAYVEDGKTKPDIGAIEGNWFETENMYQILVYYRPFGARYDRLIGGTALNSLDW